MSQQRRGGTIFLKVNGEIMDAKGSFTYGLGRPKREAIVGADAVHGYKEMPQVAFIEGAITDRGTLDVAALQDLTDVTVSLEVGSGKVITLRNAWYAADGQITTEEGEIEFRFEGMSADEVL